MIKKLLMKRLLLVLLMTIPCWSAQVIRYVDTDATGGTYNGESWGTAYQSLAAWGAAEGTNLVSDGNYHTVYCRASGGTADTGPILISGWTTDATHYIEIIGFDFPATGILDETAYRITATNTSALTLGEENVRISNIQIIVTCTATAYGIAVSITGSPIDVRIDSCIVKGICSGSGTGMGISGGTDTDVVIKISNTVVYGFISGADTEFRGIYSPAWVTADIYNCTIYNCGYGVTRASFGTTTVKNCAIGTCNDDINGTVTVDYCCTDDGDGNHAQDALSGDWDNEFTDANNGNFTPVVGGNIIANDLNDPGGGLYSLDIIDAAYVTDAWNIGAYAGDGSAADTGTTNWWWRRRHNK